MFKKIELSEFELTSNKKLIVVLIAAFLSLLAVVGFAYYGPPFYFDFIMKELGWSRATLTSGNAVGKVLVGPLFGFIAGFMIDKYGPRRLMMVGALFAAISLVGLSITSSLWMFYSFYIFNALGYVFGGPLPCQVLLSRWFDKNRGKAMGIAYLGIGLGGAIVPKLSAMLEKNFGWHTAIATVGLLVLILAVPTTLFIKDAPAKKVAANRTDTSVPIKEILKNRNFYLLALGSMFSIGAIGGVIQHLKLYLRDLQFTQDQAADVMSLVLISSLAGRVIMGWLADLFPRKYVMILIYMIVTCAVPLLLVPEFPGRIYIFAVIFGLGLGGDYMIIPLMAGDLFGVRALGRTMGIILVSDGAMEAVSPVLVGYLYDISGSYTIGFTMLIGFALAGALIISFLQKTGAHTQMHSVVEHG
jgi:sugar phosphate permease